MSAKILYRYLFGTFAIGIIASFFLVRYASNWLAESSVELGGLRSEVSSLEQQWTNLERAKKLLGEQSEEVETLSYVLPKDKDQARVVKEIYALADQANTKIDSVGFPSSTLGTAQRSVPVPTTPEPSSTPTATPTPTPAPTQNISQATPVKEIPGVQSIELSIGAITSKDPNIKGVRYEEMINLLKLIERNRRTMQIRSIGIGQTQNPNAVSTYDLTLSIVIFIKP